MHIRTAAALVLGFGFAIGAVCAAEDQALNGLQDKSQFASTKIQINRDLADHQRYKEIKPEDQKTLLATLDRMEQRWQHADDLAHLNPEDRVAMANDQEVVVGILNHASADSRVVCERTFKIASHMPVNVCKTVAQRRREQQDAQDVIQNSNLGSGGSGSK